MPNPLRVRATAVTAPVADSVAWAVGPEDPAIRRHRIRDREADVPRYGDASWSLYALGGAASRIDKTIYFEHVDGMRQDVRLPPVEWAEALRRVAYVLINEKMPQSWVMAGTRGKRRAEVEAQTIRQVLSAIRDFMAWLANKQVFRFSDVTTALLDVYYADVVANDQVQSSRHFALLSPVERLWHLAPLLPPEDRLCEADWVASQAQRDDAPVHGTGTETLDPAIADPMLMGAIAMVRDMSGDILRAYDHVQEVLAEPAVTDHKRAREVLFALAASGSLPGFVRGEAVSLDALGLRYRYGIAERTWVEQASKHKARLKHLVGQRPVTVDQPILGNVRGRAWCDGVSVRDVAAVNGESVVPLALRHLRTACWIVLGFLSGARPEEVRELPVDTLLVTPPRTDDGPMRYQLRGHLRKGEEEDDGRASEQGEMVEWVTLAVGADAARVAAEIVQRTSPASPHLFPSARPGATEPVHHAALAGNVSEWVAWYNGLAEFNGWPSAYLIPSDRGDTWDLRTFRRTTAWHIWNQPNGRRALAQQYKHVSTAMSAAYAFPSQTGLRKLMRADAKAAHDAKMRELADAIHGGGLGVSGPAASRLVDAIAQSDSVRATFMHEREAARLSGVGQVFDNPLAYSLCVYDPSLAKCMSSADLVDDPLTAPQQGACQADCRCHAFTDAEIQVVREDVADARAGAASELTPAPLRDRLGLVAERKQALVDQHESTKVFIDVATLAVRAGVADLSESENA